MGRPIRLVLSVKKFFCRVPECPRKIFTETATQALPLLLAVYLIESHTVTKLLYERHLGLVLVAEQAVGAQQLTALREQFEQTCDSKKLLALAHEVPPMEQNAKKPPLVRAAKGEADTNCTCSG